MGYDSENLPDCKCWNCKHSVLHEHYEYIESEGHSWHDESKDEWFCSKNCDYEVEEYEAIEPEGYCDDWEGREE